jgi:hypothetical protein
MVAMNMVGIGCPELRGQLPMGNKAKFVLDERRQVVMKKRHVITLLNLFLAFADMLV